jgi:hypothetical protein
MIIKLWRRSLLHEGGYSLAYTVSAIRCQMLAAIGSAEGLQLCEVPGSDAGQYEDVFKGVLPCTLV